jgi:hypothetical protein
MKLLRRIVAAIVAVIAGGTALWIVFSCRIGPVIFVISQRRGHGIHLGDVLLGVPLGMLSLGAAAVAMKAWAERAVPWRI